MDILISIIIPVYNVENYLVECLESLIIQNTHKIEIILINDGSTDSSLSICEKYSRNYSFIRLVNKDNEGVSVARNVGIGVAKGKYIIFLDSDDWLQENAIEEITRILDKNNDCDWIIYGIQKWNNSKVIRDNITQYYSNSQEDIMCILPNLLITERINSPVNKVYRKDIIDCNNIRFNEKLTIAEDLLFNTTYISHVSNIYFCEKNLYNYRLSVSNSLTKKYSSNKYDQLIEVNNLSRLLLDCQDYRISDALDFIRFKNINSSLLSIRKNNNYDKLLFSSILKKERNFIKGLTPNILGKFYLFKYIYYNLYFCDLFYTLYAIIRR